jgi:hypothetical protein
VNGVKGDWFGYPVHDTIRPLSGAGEPRFMLMSSLGILRIHYVAHCIIRLSTGLIIQVVTNTSSCCKASTTTFSDAHLKVGHGVQVLVPSSRASVWGASASASTTTPASSTTTPARAIITLHGAER